MWKSLDQEQRLLLTSNAWAVLVGIYLVFVPILWWEGVYQDQIQTIVSHVLVIAIWSLTISTKAARQIDYKEIAVLLGSLVFVNLFRITNGSYPIELLTGFYVAVVAWCLVRNSPSSEYISKCLSILVWINCVYAVSQALGYDPLFTADGVCGLFSRKNHLAILLIVTLPLCGKWTCLLSILTLFLTDSGTAVGVVLLSFWLISSPFWKVIEAVIGSFAIWHLSHTHWWVLHVAPRLEMYAQMLGSSMQMPGFLIGHGAGTWAHSGPAMKVLPDYSIWLHTLHAEGVLVLCALTWFAWKVYLSPVGKERTALLWLLIVGSVHGLWQYPRLIIVTIAVYTAWKIRNTDEINGSGWLLRHL